MDVKLLRRKAPRSEGDCYLRPITTALDSAYSAYSAYFAYFAYEKEGAPMRGIGGRIRLMGSTVRYVNWQDGEMWLGYFEAFPDYLTQGESLQELEESLRELYRDLTSEEIPGIPRVAELSVG